MTDTLPPGWAIEGFCREAGYSDASAFTDEVFSSPESYPATIYGARLYARLNKEPEDPALVAVREALAVAEESTGDVETAAYIRSGDADEVMTAALASLRASGVLK